MALEEGARSCLLRFRHRLEEDIKPSYLMDHMISDGVMTVDEEERVRTQVSLYSEWKIFIIWNQFNMLFLYVAAFFPLLPSHMFSTKYYLDKAFVKI